jgi:hypothetical protein
MDKVNKAIMSDSHLALLLSQPHKFQFFYVSFDND